MKKEEEEEIQLREKQLIKRQRERDGVNKREETNVISKIHEIPLLVRSYTTW